MRRDTLNAERARRRRPSAQWQAARTLLNKCRGYTALRQARPDGLCYGPQAAGLRLRGEQRARLAHVSAPDPCIPQGPRSGTLPRFGPTRGLRTCMYIGPGDPLWGSGLIEEWCLFSPRGALWPAHPVELGVVLRAARRRRMGVMPLCCRRGYP
jgi:hypothetical protein